MKWFREMFREKTCRELMAKGKQGEPYVSNETIYLPDGRKETFSITQAMDETGREFNLRCIAEREKVLTRKRVKVDEHRVTYIGYDSYREVMIAEAIRLGIPLDTSERDSKILDHMRKGIRTIDATFVFPSKASV